jgi:predicted phosphoadenosine phosphosulfate sulfurtransferase
MQIYLKTNVLDEALSRIRYLFDEFPEVIVGFSGGKDSTVCLHLALQVAEEKGRLPLKVMFVDQEAEWGAVIDYIRTVFEDPRIEPMWMQIDFKIENATSSTTDFLHCWDPLAPEKWMRPKEPKSFTENRYGVKVWKDLFEAIPRVEFPDTPMCFIGGVRAEESMTRRVGLTCKATYKHITYGKILSKKRQHFTFYPIYDWAYTDVWKYIHSNNFRYCEVYDHMFQHGVSVRNMRVSNLNHETAVHALYFLQEIEPDTWNALTKRLAGIGSAGQLKKSAFTTVRTLPEMFKDWREYRDYLLQNLIPLDERRAKFAKYFAHMDKAYDTYPDQEDMIRTQITGILCNDHLMTKIVNWERSPVRHFYRKVKKDPSFVTRDGIYTKNVVRSPS